MYLHLDVDSVINKKKIDENHMRPKWRSGTFATFKCYVFPQENL